MVHDGVHIGPGGELALPVGDGGERGDHQEGALDACAKHLRQQRDGLDGLPQTHLVSQDAVLPEGHRGADPRLRPEEDSHAKMDGLPEAGHAGDFYKPSRVAGNVDIMYTLSQSGGRHAFPA